MKYVSLTKNNKEIEGKKTGCISVSRFKLNVKILIFVKDKTISFLSTFAKSAESINYHYNRISFLYVITFHIFGFTTFIFLCIEVI